MNSLEELFRDEWARVLASMVRYLGDLDVAEDATQEAFAIAAERWRRTGEPTNPRAWLITTARNRALNRLRRERTFVAKAHLLYEPDPSTPPGHDDSIIADERLELLLLCCHPALAVEAQIALTLRAVGGLTTAEIARSFLVPEATMAQRIVRAKRKIAAAGISLGMPREDLLAERIAVVLTVLYLIFNRGYSGRRELATEAIRLARLTADLVRDDAEVVGLLALMLLLDARRAARFNGDELVVLAAQDPSLLDHAQIAEGRRVLDHALTIGAPGKYVIQAAIASLHADEPRDWHQIAALYGELSRITRSPVVELNRAVAIAEVEGPVSALAIIDRLALDTYPYLHATRAELLRRLGHTSQADNAYRRALALVTDNAERRHLERRLQSLADQHQSGPTSL